MGSPFKKSSLFFHNFSFIINTFLQLCVSRSVPVVQNSLLKCLSSSHTLCFRLVGVMKTVFSYCIIHGAKLMKVEGAKW
jgi:hypothetical protein